MQQPVQQSRSSNGGLDMSETAKPGMRIGYDGVITADQTLAPQIDALRAAACERIYQETASGEQTDRPELAQALKAVRQGDSLVVWRLDRLGRWLARLSQAVAALEALGASFESITERIDAQRTDAAGR